MGRPLRPRVVIGAEPADLDVPRETGAPGLDHVLHGKGAVAPATGRHRLERVLLGVPAHAIAPAGYGERHLAALALGHARGASDHDIDRGDARGHAREDALDVVEGGHALLADDLDPVPPPHPVLLGVRTGRHRIETRAPLHEGLAANRSRRVTEKRVEALGGDRLLPFRVLARLGELALLRGGAGAGRGGWDDGRHGPERAERHRGGDAEASRTRHGCRSPGPGGGPGASAGLRMALAADSRAVESKIPRVMRASEIPARAS